MKPNLKPPSVILLLVGLSVPVDACPPRCKCDWKTKHVSCTGVELVPVFHLSLQEVWLVRTKLASIPQNTFASLPNISHIYISDDSAIRSLERYSFYNLSSVMHIELHSIKTLSYIDPEAFKELPNLKYLGITNTGLTSFPVLQYIQSRQEDFILEIVENVFLQVIPANSFTGVSENALTVMLNGNGLTEIQDYAFNGSQLEEIPSQEYGFGTYSRICILWGDSWPHSLSAHMTFASHCCGLKMLKRWRREEHFCNQTRAAVTQLQESFTVLGNNLPHHLKNNFQTPTYHRNNPGIRCLDKQAKDEGLSVVDLSSEELGEELDFALCDDLHQDTGPLCTPLPDALNPCEDVMSQGFLRVLVWVVSLLAISANSLVLFILLTSQQKLSVTRFLLGHLAFADGCMGMYLLLIATVDYYTHSNYYHYAISWQTGIGCQMAGILSLFASELSVYTLTAISFQRWHAIFNAMRPDRQMRLRHAAMLMLIGWLLCGTVAFLPVLGVNTYQRVSICLPMDTETFVAQFYIVSVLILNIMAFIVVCLCYLHIYCMVHNPQHDSSRYDTSMAKRMAVLIFTNFLCLAPICFYGLVAVFHQPLMTITDSKVLLVFFYPLNSCAHPFFYAILTKAFHRDILMLFSRMGLCQKQAYHSRSQFLSITPHVYRETLPGRAASQQHPKT
ncbi:PREDICTED: thyrotropin receptor-like isoform X2 [Poecilia mexicana]|uniref:thyrotropin receptor-like isoform X2 n=1 Tax=Poecilia mexicana TaxID=48701 RepID=UPI00072DCE6E|nr:PREDICTED: thyrotropin receptor-like isoform X2 [Poecilia mexicana]